MAHRCADCEIQFATTPFVLGKKRQRIVCKECHDRKNAPCRFCGSYQPKPPKTDYDNDGDPVGTVCHTCNEEFFVFPPKKQLKQRRPFLRSTSLTRFEYFLVESWEDTIDYYAIYELSGPEHYRAMFDSLSAEMNREPRIYEVLWKLLAANQHNLAMQLAEMANHRREMERREIDLKVECKFEYEALSQCEDYIREFRESVEQLTAQYGRSCLA